MKNSLKILSLVLLFVIAIAALTGCKGKSGEKINEGADGLAFYPLDDGTYGVRVGNAFEFSEIVIPANHNGKDVTAVLGKAFYACSNLTNITIPSSVTTIGEEAFAGCSSLTNLTIPDSVMSIGSGAFSGCSALTEMTIPFVGAKAGVTSSDTDQYPFGYLFGTSSYTGGVETKQYYYGSSTSSTTSSTYYIPSSLKKVTVTGGNILHGAFYKCSNLTSITIPDSVTSIDGSAFWDCSSLTSITIPNSVTSIGFYAFRYCSSLTSINFQGTKSQWNNITKLYNWNYDTDSYVIHCTDGDISK